VYSHESVELKLPLNKAGAGTALYAPTTSASLAWPSRADLRRLQPVARAPQRAQESVQFLHATYSGYQLVSESSLVQGKCAALAVHARPHATVVEELVLYPGLSAGSCRRRLAKES
jgi:hypothetical protein